MVSVVGACAVLFGLGMDVHAVVMAVHGPHDGRHVAADGEAGAHAHDHAVPGAHHAHSAPAAVPPAPHGSSDDDSAFECCAATVCPPASSVLPMCIDDPAADGRGAFAPAARIAGLSGVGHTPLLRPPR